MARRLLLLLLALAALGAGSAQSAPAVVGGSAVEIQSAPWTVFIQQDQGSTVILCSGSILDSLHVLTAAHCVFQDSGAVASPTAFEVEAGISNFNQPLATDAEQDRGVSSLRVHPGYVQNGSPGPDDVAVLALSAPLDLSGPAVQAVALPTPGAAIAAGTTLSFAGFGRETNGTDPDGSLNSIAAVASEPGSCGTFLNTVVPNDDAVAFCASSPAATICNGDSGGGLVTTTTPPVLVGVAEAATTECQTGVPSLYMQVSAPEILQFIQGNDQPPAAPKQTDQTYVTLSWKSALVPGETLTCTSGDWSTEPAATAYAFVDTRTDTVLQQSAATTFVLRRQDVGAEIACRALATNAGGTAIEQTTSTGGVRPVPKLSVAVPRGVQLVPGRVAAVRVILETGAGLVGKFGVCLTPPASVAPRACASAKVTDGGSGGYPLTVRLRVKPTARIGTARVAIAAVAGIARANAKAALRVSRA